MSDDEQLATGDPQRLVLADPLPAAQLDAVAAAAALPRVQWGRAAALQLVVGGIAGFLVPFCFYVVPQGQLFGEIGLFGDAVWIVVFLISAGAVGLIGGGIPLLVAWLRGSSSPATAAVSAMRCSRCCWARSGDPSSRACCRSS